MPAGPSVVARRAHSASASRRMTIVYRDAPVRPVFVGGTGRSGTTVAGRLLGHHKELRSTNPRELRFIASAGGVAEAYATAVGNPGVGSDFEAITPDQVVETMWNHWYQRIKPSGAVSGLRRRLPKKEMKEVCGRYVAEFRDDPYAASRRFVETIVSSNVRSDPTLRWVDTTPANARAADRVLALFPDGVVIHMMRDGRDVAASFVSKHFGPTEVMDGLTAWRDRMVEAHRAEQGCPPGSVIRVDLERLAVTDRDETLTRIVEVLGVKDNRRWRRWFDKAVLPTQVHAGRWRRDYDDATAAAIDARYAEILTELDALGVPHP